MNQALVALPQKFFFRAAPAIVWECFTRPDLIKEWLMGMEIECDWKVGSPYRSRLSFDGQEFWEKGTVLQSEPPKILELEFLSSWDHLEDKPENYQRVRYELEPYDSGTMVHFTNYLLPQLFTEEKRKTMVDAWHGILPIIIRQIDTLAGRQYLPMAHIELLKTDVDTLWQWLTKPELIKQWMMDIDIDCDWQIASPYRSKMMWEGQQFWEKGMVLQSEYHKAVQIDFITSWDNLEDKPENYQRMMYKLVPKEGGVELHTITDYKVGLYPEEKFKEMEQAWDKMFSTLKSLIEV